MPKARFVSAMGFLFAGEISRTLLGAICLQYAAGDIDYTEEGGYQKVRWKQFALDFDEIPPHQAPMSDFEEILADPRTISQIATQV